MSREKILESIILKKQDFSEADQIITLFSKEEGKLRCLVKAANLPTSKLQPVLQPLFLSRVTLANGSNTLPKVIRGQSIKSYGKILDESEKLSAWFVVSELLNRALPDGQTNLPLFEETLRYLDFLNESELPSTGVKVSAMQYQIRVLGLIGLGIRILPGSIPDKLWFSMDKGGFFSEDTGVDSFEVSRQSYDLFLALKEQDYALAILALDPNDALFKLITKFVTYQLEREIKSSKFL